jgi:hypothetical protein
MESYIAPIILGVVGSSFFYVGIYILYLDRKIRRKGRKTLATVIDIDEVKSHNGDTYQLILKFLGKHGEEVIQPLGFSSSVKPKKAPPYRIPIYYLEENDTYKLVLANNQLKIVVGVCIFLAGAAMLLFFILHTFEIINFS